MADFTKFKIGSTSYNVKDPNAGRSLDLSGTDLSLKNAAGNTISTVTLPSGDTSYSVVIEYKDTSVQGSYTNLYDVMAANNGTWSIYDIYPALPAGAHLSDVHDHITYLVQVSFPNASTGYQNAYLYNTVTASSHPIFFIPKLNVTGEVVGCVKVEVNEANNTIISHVYTSFSGGSSSSAITSANIYCPNASLWDVASAQPTTIQVDEVIIDGQTGQLLTLAELIQVIMDKFNTAHGIDLKISITGQDWSAEVLSYSINSGTLTIYFEVFAGAQMYKRYATVNSSSPTSLSLVQAQ